MEIQDPPGSGKGRSGESPKGKSYKDESLSKKSRQFLQQVEDLLKSAGYIPGEDSDPAPEPLGKQPSYLENQNAGEDIFGNPLICDFLILSPKKSPSLFGVIVRWLEPEAEDGDPEDEIFPYLVQSIRKNSRENSPGFVLVIGGSCRPEAKEWLAGQCGDNLLGAFFLEEFESWLSGAQA